MVTYTTTYNLAKPTVGDDEDVWGGYLNGNFDTLESLLKGTTSLTSLSLTGTFTIDNTTQTSFNVEYADDGSGIGPILRTFRDSATPAANDLLGGLDFKGNDSGGNETFYSRVMGRIVDPTDGSEDGAVDINVAKAGTAAWATSGLVARFNSDGMYLRDDIIFEGATSNAHQTTLTVTDPTADRTITLPDASGTVWTSGNDGSGSGLDADTVDGIEASSFLRSDATDAFSGSITSSATGIGMTFYGAAAWRVSSADSAHQRADARDDVGESRLHWYGVNTSGSSRAFKHAWYDGSAYVNVTASSSNINFERTTGTANLQVHGNTVWHAGNDGSGSGLDADTLDGVQGANYLRSDQADTFNGNLTISSTGTIGGSTLTNGYLQVTDGSNTLAMDSNEIVSNSTLYIKPLAGTLELGGSQTTNFGSNVVINGTLTLGANTINDVEDIYLRDRIYHDGDTNTYIQFHAADQFRVVTGGAERFEVNNSRTYARQFLTTAALTEIASSKTGTAITCDADDAGAFYVTMSGNTTFTFGSTLMTGSVGFIVELTGNATTAYTVTWPTSVDWAGGTAPDAPAVGETDIYVFWTRDGGTTWYGVQSIDAAA